MANLLETIVEAIDDKKGRHIISLDLSQLDGAIAEHFVITHADSPVQVDAIADGVEEAVEKELRRRVIRVEGKQVGEWVVMDYGEIMVHIFQTEKRDFYALEDLWADADLTRYQFEQ
ncbi:MAG: ribosome silencing factor [Rikenellaceae bacterium]|nr:ribosome silencing factor [Rikenellaceae bacterium]